MIAGSRFRFPEIPTLLTALGLLAGPGDGAQATTRGAPVFVDVTDSLGIGDPDHRHFAMAVVDINRDGWVDVYYANGLGNPVLTVPPSGQCPDSSETPVYPDQNINVLFMNQGDGTFGPDVAPQVGLDDFWNAMRNIWGDYDNDGKRDLLSHNFISSPLYRAAPSGFVDASISSELELCLNRGTGASWVDLDLDGDLDIYGGEYDFSRLAVDHVNKMFLNDGDGTFTDVTSMAGADLPDNPMGVAFADYDNDGDQDFFVTNSHEVPTRLYRNDGVHPITLVPQFVDVAAEAGVAVIGEPNRGVGAAWGDYNNDERLDLLFSREGDSRLWRNEGPDGNGVWRFADVSAAGGMNMPVPAPWGFWGGNFVDLDNDGWLDVILTNRNVGHSNRVFLNNGDETWTEMAAALGLALPAAASMGVVGADIENDGDLDLFILSHTLGQPNSVFRNDTPGNNWIQFRLTGTVSNRDAVGARITVAAELSPGQTVFQIREVTAGTGFFADFPRIQTFGLGSATSILAAKIEWPSGLVDVTGPLAIGQRHDFVEASPVSARPLEDRPSVDVRLESVRPNPFHPVTQVQFAIAREADIRLQVHDVTGRLLRTLVNRRSHPPGRHTVAWDGTDGDGRSVAAGIYFLRLQSGPHIETKKMTLVR